MAHHGDTAFDQIAYRVRRVRAALNFNGLTPCFHHNARGALKGGFDAILIGTKGQINYDKRFIRAAHHRLAMQYHHIERHAHRGCQAMHHHPNAIADKDKITMLIQYRRRRRIISGQANNRLPALTRGDFRRAHTRDVSLCRHGAGL